MVSKDEIIQLLLFEYFDRLLYGVVYVAVEVGYN